MVACIDYSNIFFICWSVFLRGQKEKFGDDYLVKEEDTGLFFHLVTRKIMDYITTYKNTILCWEGKNSTAWRKSIWPPYKENRHKDDPNYKWVGPLMEKSYEFFSLFHTKCLKVDGCEGDDCIYATCKYYAEKGEEVRIISTDRDLSQIMNYWDTVSQFNPVKREEVKKDENILLEKALVGDASDNIKPFKGLGPKTFEKMMADKEFWNKKMTNENQQVLEEVMKIVDLRKYPLVFQEAIKNELDKPWNEFNSDSVEKFFLDNDLRVCYNDWRMKWLPSIFALDHEIKEDAVEEIEDLLKGFC